MPVSTLVIVNDAAYGSDRTYNALRLAGALARRDDTQLRVFLMGDGITCAISGQQVPNGYYHLDRILEAAAGHGAEIGCCGTCMDARGIGDEMLIAGAARSTLDELAHWTTQAEKILVF